LLIHAGGGELDFGPVLVATKENADGRLVAPGHHIGLEPVQVKIHLPGVGGLEGPDLEVDENVAAEETVVKDEFDTVVLAPLGHAELAGLETESASEFEEETVWTFSAPNSIDSVDGIGRGAANSVHAVDAISSAI